MSERASERASKGERGSGQRTRPDDSCRVLGTQGKYVSLYVLVTSQKEYAYIVCLSFLNYHDRLSALPCPFTSFSELRSYEKSFSRCSLMRGLLAYLDGGSVDGDICLTLTAAAQPPGENDVSLPSAAD